MSKRPLVLALALGAAAVFASAAGAAVALHWQLKPTPTNAQFRGLAPVNDRVAWVSGTGGTVLRTVDGGASFENVSPPGTDALQFRDIAAFDARNAVISSVGDNPGDFRFYRTQNGGRTWARAYTNAEPTAFYDCMTFFDDHRGIALSDPVGGAFRILVTGDAGRSWHVARTSMPPALPGEFAFAASGQCLVSSGRRDAWFATGGAARSRVFHSSDGGLSWTVADTPIPAGLTAAGAAGIYALAFRDAQHGIAVGGDFSVPDEAPHAIARTSDGGRTWTLADDAPDQYRSGVTFWRGNDAIAVGPTGSDLSSDGGRTWQRIGPGAFDSVSCTGDGSCWASGPDGRVARLVPD